MWENYYLAKDEPEKYKRLDREEREKEDAENRKYGMEEFFVCKEVPGSKDDWDREEWFRFYSQGLPPVDEDLYCLEAEMGYLWSEVSYFEPRQRFRKWNDATFSWEHEWRQRMYIRATKLKIRIDASCECCYDAGCPCCYEARSAWLA